VRFVLKRANSSVCRASGPLWELTHEGSRLSVFYPGKGTPPATTTFERVSVGGCRVLLGCGGAGTLVGNLRHGEVVMVEAAVRDEGASFHYFRLPERSSPTMRWSPCWRRLPGKVGSLPGGARTDGLFQDTAGRLHRRVEKGCLVVDRESRAAGRREDPPRPHRGVYLSAGDDIAGSKPNENRWREDLELQANLLHLAASAAHRLADAQRRTGRADRKGSGEPRPSRSSAAGTPAVISGSGNAQRGGPAATTASTSAAGGSPRPNDSSHHVMPASLSAANRDESS